MAENKDFRLKAVAELLDGEHHFFIPSYQRGYRWDRKQVEDLLKDIYDFARTAKNGEFYCLQPIVVKPANDEKNNNRWIVIDGQQRLTTMLLLLNHLRKERTSLPGKNYTIEYETRPDLDFGNLDGMADIDSYYASHAQSTIEKWFLENGVRNGKFEDVLFFDDGKEQVRFIWYVVSDNDDENDVAAIRVFHNLNRGKIRLTNAELIKALFILKWTRSDSGTQGLSIGEFAFQWDLIENELHDSRFWSFLANNDYRPASRIDIIFDFLTGKTPDNDLDYSYRRFQELFDAVEVPKFWKDKGIENFAQAWQRVMETFYAFRHWFEDPALYHYAGYLISIGVPMQTIFSKLENKPKQGIAQRLQELIKEKLDIENIDSISYPDRPRCRKVLLLFNVMTYLNSSYRFPFDRFKKENWDIEHVDSQTTNPLNSVPEKIIWLGYIEYIHYNDAEIWPQLQRRAKEMIATLERENRDEGDGFKKLYAEILAVAQKNNNPDSDEDQDSIDNLALLDERTNRSYGNALFQTKREKIIKADTEGRFIPICTKNLFLKYYTRKDNDPSQWENRWNDRDRKSYLKAIHDVIDPIIK